MKNLFAFTPFRAGIAVAGQLMFLVVPCLAEQGGRAVVVRPSSFAISAPLRDLGPIPEPMAHETPSAVVDAPAVVEKASSRTNLLDINGTSASNFVYPDSNGAVGATQYMQWTNARYAVRDKTTGALLAGPTEAKLLWANLPGECASTNAGDGIINYDKAASRWIVTHHTDAGVPYQQCVAVSTTSDATGTYFLYAFNLTSTEYPDYPQLGVWPDAYYVTTNLLDPTKFTNVSAQVCALDRTNMLLGNPAATAQCLTTKTNLIFSVLQPADLDGAAAPPTGHPNFLMALDVNSLDLYKFHVDWVTPANTTLTGPTNIPVTPFTQACSGGLCIPQEGTTAVLDGVGDRLLHRLVYRVFKQHEVLLVTHSVVAGTTVGVRWYEIQNPNGTPVVLQQGTIAPPDSNYRWLGSIGMDKMGNIAVGYSVSSPTMFPAVRYTGRLATDPLNQMETESSIFSGVGAQTSGGNNWGNASSMTIDPVDDCTFWYTNEYLKVTGRLWSTRIASFKFNTCQ